MKLTLITVGRARSGPEAALVADYLGRFERLGRNIGLGPVRLLEVEAKKGGGMQEEARLLQKALPDGAVLVVLDERGQGLTSPQFATRLRQWRDDGQGELAFMIGGADGLAPDLRARATLALSFGKMVWPHMLARVMLAEQLYRAANILSGTPYHRA